MPRSQMPHFHSPISLSDAPLSLSEAQSLSYAPLSDAQLSLSDAPLSDAQLPLSYAPLSDAPLSDA